MPSEPEGFNAPPSAMPKQPTLPTWKRLGFESAEAWRRSLLEGFDGLDASGDLQVPPPPRHWPVTKLGGGALGNAFWLVLMVLMLLIGFALGASCIIALRDGTASLITTFWGTK